MRKGLAAAGVAALITTGVAACGAEDAGTPQGTVTDAFTRLGEQKSVAVGLSFEGTPDQIYAALKDQDDFERADADMLAGLRLSASFSSDKALAQTRGDDKGASSSVELAGGAKAGSGGKPLVGLRSVGRKHYVRLDLKGLTALDTAGRTGLSGLNGLLGSADDLPSSSGSVKALVNGGWVSVDPKAFEGLAGLADSLGGKDGSGAGSATGSGGSLLHSPLSGFGLPADLGRKTFAELFAPLQQTVAKDAKITDLGSQDGAEHLRITAPARTFAKDLRSSYGSPAKDLPGDLDDSLDHVPDRTAAVDVAVKDGRLSHITVDLAQFDDTIHGKLPVGLSVDGAADPVTAPAGAQQLDPQDLIGLVMSKLGDFTGKAGKLVSGSPA